MSTPECLHAVLEPSASTLQGASTSISEPEAVAAPLPLEKSESSLRKPSSNPMTFNDLENAAASGIPSTEAETGAEEENAAQSVVHHPPFEESEYYAEHFPSDKALLTAFLAFAAQHGFAVVKHAFHPIKGHGYLRCSKAGVYEPKNGSRLNARTKRSTTQRTNCAYRVYCTSTTVDGQTQWRAHPATAGMVHNHPPAASIDLVRQRQASMTPAAQQWLEAACAAETKPRTMLVEIKKQFPDLLITHGDISRFASRYRRSEKLERSTAASAIADLKTSGS